MNIVRAGSLVLEPQTAAHAAEMFNVLSDPAIYEFENSPPESQTWLARRYAKLESRISADGEEQWLNWVVRLPTGALAGYVQATISRDGVAHIAYELASRFWRQGIGSTAVGAMLKEPSGNYSVRVFVATLKARNYRSIGLLRKLGFTEKPPRGLSIIDHEPDEIIMHKGKNGEKSSGIRT
jgi:[ribosomal protein S5]-alanine N-acetyltransferase